MVTPCPATVNLSRQFIQHAPLPRQSIRHASLTSSISRGVRKAAAALGAAERRRIRDGQLEGSESQDDRMPGLVRENTRRRIRDAVEQRSRLNFLRSDSIRPNLGGPLQPDDLERRKRAKARARAQGMLVDAPSALPYTESASEFLYGTFAVLAALRAKRRILHKLYIWCGEDGNLVDSDTDSTSVVRAAMAAGVPILRVAGNWDKLLDKMSDRRPHNGFVLEAGPIPRVKVSFLEQLTTETSPTAASLGVMTTQERESLDIKSNAKIYTIPRPTHARRFPFLLWLDKVTDTGNMGAIFRSAYFLGVDAIVLPQHGTAPLSAVTVKASAGTAEHLPILLIDSELDFMRKSQENGWIFFAAGATHSKSTLASSPEAKKVETDSPNDILKSRPCVLVLGNEGEGLRTFLQKQANHSISISGARADTVVDSLNVSVAAALLAHRFLASTLHGKVDHR